ncbi:MAG: hypothetical protein IT444_12660 [Phycisphaeraceae bacterium]|nr:hypothetical protein [Phycisphaeraceae bacterium]
MRKPSTGEWRKYLKCWRFGRNVARLTTASKSTARLNYPWQCASWRHGRNRTRQDAPRLAPGAVINGYTLPSTGDFEEYDHGDYMGKSEFFERIHGADLGCPPDNKISKDPSMGTLKNIGKSVW